MEAREVIRIAEHAPVSDIFEARELYEASMAEYLQHYKGDPECYSWSHLRALANVYLAGRMQGIRDERRR